MVVRTMLLLSIGLLALGGCGQSKEAPLKHRVFRQIEIEPPAELTFPDPPEIPARLLGPSPPIAEESKK
ncbi:MAG: hypothetical protein JW818_05625 [Pirellulales bacterium]|nr:hypothetical protein [Pirellulales bacterium]